MYFYKCRSHIYKNELIINLVILFVFFCAFELANIYIF